MDPRSGAKLRVISLFEELTDSALGQIAASCQIRTYEPDTQILGEQEKTTDVFFVLAGNLRVNSFTQAGREVIYIELGAGDIFGEFSAVDGLPRSAAVFALSGCTLARMRAERFFDILREHGTVSARLVELLVAKVRHMSERVFEISALAIRERVRRELLRLAASGTPIGQSIVIRPAPTHYEIAARIGTHREAVTREFNRLEEERVLEVRRRQIRIVDVERLRRAGEL